MGKYSEMTPEEKRIFDERIRKAKEERLKKEAAQKPKPKSKPKPEPEPFSQFGHVIQEKSYKKGGIVKSPCGFDKINKMVKKKK